jgi:hypothetical protein
MEKNETQKFIYVLFYTLKKELFFAIRALLDWEVKSTSQLINSILAVSLTETFFETKTNLNVADHGKHTKNDRTKT